jgi:hypothetical protein
MIKDALSMAPNRQGTRTGICESVIGRLAMNRFDGYHPTYFVLIVVAALCRIEHS